MKKVLLTICLLYSVIFSGSVHSQDSLTQSFRDFDYNKSTNMKGMQGYAQGKMKEYFNETLSKSFNTWADDAKKKWVKTHGKIPNMNALKKSGVYNVAGEVPTWEMSGDYRNFLKKEIKTQMTNNMGSHVDSFMREKVFQGAQISDKITGDVDKMVSKVQENIMGDLNDVVDKSFQGWNLNIQNNLNQVAAYAPANFQKLLNNKLSQSMGNATKNGLKGFIDDEMFDMLGDNFGFKLEDILENSADVLDNFSANLDGFDISGVPDLSGLANKFGELGNLKDFVGQAGGILDGSPLGNAFGLNPENYFGMTTDLFDKLSVDLPKASLPNIEIPAPGYAGILAAAAATHFARAFKGFFIDPTEIQRGITLIKTMIWQLDKKQDSFMLIGGDIGGQGLLGAFGIPISQTLKDKLKELRKKAEKISGKEDDKNTKKELQELIDELDEFKKGVDQSIYDKLYGDEEVLASLEEDFYEPQGCEDFVKQQSTLDCSYQSVDLNADEYAYGATEEAFNVDLTSPLDPVKTYSGEFAITENDLRVRGIGIDYEFTRHYGNQRERVGDLGYNWSHNYEEQMLFFKDSSDLLWQMADGRRYGFKWSEKYNKYLAPQGHFVALKKSGKKFVLTHEDNMEHHFNEQGQLIKIQDQAGNALAFQYGLIGEKLKLVRVIDTLGRQIKYRYNAKGLVEAVVDPFGREIKLGYVGELDLVTVRTPVSDAFPKGKITRYSYSGGKLEPRLNHNLTMIMDPNGQIYLKNIYGIEGLNKDRLIRQRFGDRKTEEMKVEYKILAKKAVQNVNKPVSQTVILDRNGNRHKYTHNYYGLRLSYSVNDQFLESNKYNRNHQVIEHLAPNGLKDIFVYNDKVKNTLHQGFLTEHQAISEKGSRKIIRYDYDSQTGLLKTKKILASGEIRKENYEYNDKGLLSQIANGDLKISHLYNAQGQLVQEKKPGLVRHFIYAGENLVKIKDVTTEGLERVVQMDYDRFGNLSQEVDAVGQETRYWYDVLNQVVKKQDALGHKTYFKYDNNNNIKEMVKEYKGSQSNYFGHQLAEKFTYNHLDNLVKREIQVSASDWVTEKYAYDSNENLTEFTDWKGLKWQHAYNFKNERIQSRLQNQVQEELVRGPEGEVLQAKNALGHSSHFQYDDFGRVDFLYR